MEYLDLNVLLLLGIVIMIAWGSGKILSNFKLPAVIGYIAAGIVTGTSCFKLFGPITLGKTALLNDIALGIIAFMIGGEMNFAKMRHLGKSIITIAVFEAAGAFLLVFGASWFMIGKMHYALILGAIASATAPAATVSVISQYRAKGPLTTTILGVVGMDDAVALIIYAFASAMAMTFISASSVALGPVVLKAAGEVLLSLLSGISLGFVTGFGLRKLKSVDETFAVIMGVILIGEGIACQFHLSELLVVMAMAVVAANVAPARVSSIMKGMGMLGFPLVGAFFCLAATRLDFALLPKIGGLGMVYVICRMAGKYFGARAGAALSKSPDVIRRYIGLALWPQIGVAVALAIMVERDFGSLGPAGADLSQTAINVLLFTTILTEIVGPLATRYALHRAGEIKL
ncbi:MAG: potassium transporter [Candidatus Wallbacteria bacterium HGW-Wallbacteria-1]|jgi:NhaP-type Na+/H+ or K+/H+ antiporter|uniref:Potassium transporter n=1 Tax=Candidatus Wallbacteria bacterium HGW-Wallbacteria-1 TaxID=2013854 RepID=A0A2N1PML0_9BACT|nr:MAG: potassium transporter [Candidatus Wallbacteria bacterium HGW-Wallbacteria-1]